MVKQRFPAAYRDQTEAPELTEIKRGYQMPTEIKLMSRGIRCQTYVALSKQRSNRHLCRPGEVKQRSPEVIRSKGQRSRRGFPKPTEAN